MVIWPNECSKLVLDREIQIFWYFFKKQFFFFFSSSICIYELFICKFGNEISNVEVRNCINFLCTVPILLYGVDFHQLKNGKYDFEYALKTWNIVTDSEVGFSFDCGK